MEAEDVGTADWLDVLAVMVALWNSETTNTQQEQQRQERKHNKYFHVIQVKMKIHDKQ